MPAEADEKRKQQPGAKVRRRSLSAPVPHHQASREGPRPTAVHVRACSPRALTLQWVATSISLWNMRVNALFFACTRLAEPDNPLNRFWLDHNFTSLPDEGMPLASPRSGCARKQHRGSDAGLRAARAERFSSGRPSRERRDYCRRAKPGRTAGEPIAHIGTGAVRAHSRNPCPAPYHQPLRISYRPLVVHQSPVIHTQEQTPAPATTCVPGG